MIILSYSNIDIIQGVIGYGNASEGITDWRISNTSNGNIGTSGIFNIFNSSSVTANLSIIDNGNVVGILSTTADGLNFDSNITIGTSSFEIGRRGTTYKNTNLVMGFDVMNDNIVTGQHNIGMGSEAGASLSSGNYNIMIGYQAGRQIGPGSSNVLVGQGAGNSC